MQAQGWRASSCLRPVVTLWGCLHAWSGSGRVLPACRWVLLWDLSTDLIHSPKRTSFKSAVER